MCKYQLNFVVYRKTKKKKEKERYILQKLSKIRLEQVLPYSQMEWFLQLLLFVYNYNFISFLEKRLEYRLFFICLLSR